MTATNALGTSPSSPPSGTAVPAPVPDAPPQPSAVPNTGSITVTFSTPPSNGPPITSYTATCVSSDGGRPASRTGPGSPITVIGVSNGRTYTCSVAATSAAGTGPPSPPSVARGPLDRARPPMLRGAGPRDGAAIVVFTPSNNAGVSTSFLAACTSSNAGAPGLASGPTSPITVPGLSNGKTYRCSVRAVERDRRERPLGHFECVHRRHARRPRDCPRRIRARDRVTGPAQVTFNPGSINGSPVSAYRATCRQDFTGVPFVGTSLRSPITIGNLLTGHGYTCSVVATNARGTSPTSNSVHAIVGTPAVPPITHVLPIRNGRRPALR